MKQKNKFINSTFKKILFILIFNNSVLAQDTANFKKENPFFTFEKYPIKIISKNWTIKKPILSTSLAKQYKTIIANAMGEPVNFAGHYRVVTWGCGTDCRGFAIIDKASGMVYTLHNVNYVAGAMGNDDDRLNFKKDSQLFVITGRLNDEDEGIFYYLWTGKSLKLLGKNSILKKIN